MKDKEESQPQIPLCTICQEQNANVRLLPPSALSTPANTASACPASGNGQRSVSPSFRETTPAPSAGPPTACSKPAAK